MDLLAKIGGFIALLAWLALCGWLRLLISRHRAAQEGLSYPKLTLQHKVLLGVCFALPVVGALGWLWFTQS